MSFIDFLNEALDFKEIENELMSFDSVASAKEYLSAFSKADIRNIGKYLSVSNPNIDRIIQFTVQSNLNSKAIRNE